MELELNNAKIGNTHEHTHTEIKPIWMVFCMMTTRGASIQKKTKPIRGFLCIFCKSKCTLGSPQGLPEAPQWNHKGVKWSPKWPPKVPKCRPREPHEAPKAPRIHRWIPQIRNISSLHLLLPISPIMIQKYCYNWISARTNKPTNKQNNEHTNKQRHKQTNTLRAPPKHIFFAWSLIA